MKLPTDSFNERLSNDLENLARPMTTADKLQLKQVIEDNVDGVEVVVHDD